MSIRILKSHAAVAGVAVAAAALPAVALAAQPTHTRARPAAATANWQVAMKGSTAYRKANGSAQYQSQPGQRDLQIEVQRVRSLAGRTVVFSAAGHRLGSARVSTTGQADITRNTELGQKVPAIVHGSRVTVRTTGGKLIISGRF
jgi:opacity protein-like surface antigen